MKMRDNDLPLGCRRLGGDLSATSWEGWGLDLRIDRVEITGVSGVDGKAGLRSR
jgi:serine protease inhibitor ecotin